MMTRVKICGITTAQDARDALEFGADMLGLNFYPLSPRCLTVQAAENVVAALPPATKVVGVFVEPAVEEVLRIAKRLQLWAIQLHGDETAECIRAISAVLPVIKAARTRTEAERTLELGCPILLDAASPVRGGSGKLADWTLAKEISRMTPHFYLAGGLTPGNVSQAIDLVRPFAVDVSSGVEHSPGHKSRAAMKAFLQAAQIGERSDPITD